MNRGREPSTPFLRALFAILACALTALPPAVSPAEAGDTIELPKGRSVRGFLTRGQPESRINTFGCSLPEMTLGVMRLRTRDVQSVEPDDPNEPTWRALVELAPNDVGRRVTLLRLAYRAKAKMAIERLAAEIGRAPGGSDVDVSPYMPRIATRLEEARLRGDPNWIQAHRETIRRVVAARTPQDRKAASASQAASPPWPANPMWIERAARMLRADRGVQLDIEATLVPDELKGARYSLFVPDDIDPLDPRPLVIGLHGGGIRDTKGLPVRGRGKEFLPVLLEQAKALGWYVVCPTAVVAPWGAADNGRWLDALIAEVGARWNVDLHRVHLIGVGGGANGAWVHGARMARELASVAVASGDKPQRVSRITGTGTALWIFHGERDEITPVDPVRKAAEKLQKSKADFVYCELPQEGHGLPPSALRDWAHYVLPKRRPRTKTPWPQDSLLVPPTSLEIALWGAPQDAWGVDGLESLEDMALVERLRAGRTDAGPVGQALQAHYAPGKAPADLREAVRALVADRDTSLEARIGAARVLGAWRDAEAVPVLGDALRASPHPRLATALTQAIALVGSTDNVEDLRFALLAMGRAWSSMGGQQIPLVALERAADQGAALAEALARCGAPEDMLGSLEEVLAIGILRDRRPVLAPGQPAAAQRARAQLLGALARTYRHLKAPRTLADMLRALAGKNPVLLRAVQVGTAQGWR